MTDLRAIPIAQLAPSRNIRSDLGDLSEITESVREHGILQPIRVRPIDGGRYQVIAGHRRVAAARAAGLSSIPAVVSIESDSNVAVQNVVENLQRENLTPLELARGVRELQLAFRLTLEQIARALSKTPSQVRTLLRAATLPDNVLGRLESGEGRTQNVRGLTLRHIERLLGDVPLDGSADAQSKATAAAALIGELIDETEQRGVRINAHQADEVSRQLKSGRMSVREAVDLVTANPERFRYSRAYATPGELESDTWATYRELQRQLTGIAHRLKPEVASAFSERERMDLLEGLGDIFERLSTYRLALLRQDLEGVMPPQISGSAPSLRADR